MKRFLRRRYLILVLILCVYPVCVIAYTWTFVLRSDFKGGRRGQLDAYRHSLASAIVSYTLGEWAVNFTTLIFESSDSDSGIMDIHNNSVGANIGSKAKSFHDIEPSIRKAVMNGEVLSDDPEKIYWLPKEKWGESKLW